MGGALDISHTVLFIAVNIGGVVILPVRFYSLKPIAYIVFEVQDRIREFSI